MPDFLLTRSYDEFDALAADATAWELDFVPVERGVHRGALLLSETGGVQLGEARFERGLIQRGASPRGNRTFVVPAPPMHTLLWRGHVIHQDDLMVFPPGGELSSRSGPDFHVFTISVPEVRLAASAASLGLPEPRGLIGCQEVFRLAPGGLNAVRAALAEHVASITTRRVTPDAIDSDHVTLRLLQALAVARGRASQIAPSRALLLRRAETLLKGPLHERTSSVRALVQSLGTSRRTLHRAFVEHYGDGPKAVIEAARLSAVRTMLLKTTPARGRVSAVASRAGYWHMGKFAGDYHRQFGELPSDTLHRDRPSPPRPG